MSVLDVLFPPPSFWKEYVRMNVRLIPLNLCLAAAAVLTVAVPAAAAPGNPHLEQSDGCDHGNSGKPCKADPQPDKGKDCDLHGNHGGVNEDHCAPTTTSSTSTTSTTTTTTTTTTDPTITTVMESEDSTSMPPNLSRPTDPPPDTLATGPPGPPTTECVTPDGFPYGTSYPECLVPIGAAPEAPAPLTELPRTGVPLRALTIIGAAWLVAGLGIRWATR